MNRFVIALVASCLVATPALAADGRNEHEVAFLMRQDRMLRERIAQLQLDALVARVDQALDGRHARSRPAPAAANHDIQHELALYSY